MEGEKSQSQVLLLKPLKAVTSTPGMNIQIFHIYILLHFFFLLSASMSISAAARWTEVENGWDWKITPFSLPYPDSRLFQSFVMHV